MTDLQKKQILQMRTKGDSYGDIADRLNLSRSTVSSYCRRNIVIDEKKSENSVDDNEIKHCESDGNTEKEPNHYERLCRNCGKVIVQNPGVRRKCFCSKECRVKWWREHPEKGKGNSEKKVKCPGCGRTFMVYWNKDQKYCSHECYIKARFGGDKNA